MDERVRTDEERVTAEVKPPRRLAVRRVVRWVIGIVIVLAILAFGIRYWHHSRLYASTDDAYVNADVVQVAPQVSGLVVQVAVVNQQHVSPGQLLFQIDPRPFQIALEQAQANLDLAQQNIGEQSAAVAAARAQLAEREAQLANAQSNLRRAQRLTNTGILSRQTVESTQMQARTAQAAVKAAQANLVQAENALGVGGAQNATLRAAQARVAQAKLDLAYARVSASTSGTVANLTLRPGTSVQAGQPLFSVVSDREYWVDANFKETDLARIHPGQAATVTLDMYPGHTFQGVVESLSGGSGTAFSLLPPENATGNWVKVTQRVPVRVRILDPDPHYPLRIGTTATVEVRVS